MCEHTTEPSCVQRTHNRRYSRKLRWKLFHTSRSIWRAFNDVPERFGRDAEKFFNAHPAGGTERVEERFRSHTFAAFARTRTRGRVLGVLLFASALGVRRFAASLDGLAALLRGCFVPIGDPERRATHE